MRRNANVLALSVAAVTGVAILAGSASATTSQPQSRTVTLTIHAIDRNGRPEPIEVGQYTGYDVTNPQGGLVSGRNRLEAGRYAVAVEVPTVDSHGDDIANTLIVRNINLQRSMTLTLSARHSVPVQVSLDRMQLSDVMGNVCVNTGPGYGVLQALSDAVQGPPPLYIVPYRSKKLRFVYQATASTARGTEANLAGSYSGLPARPVARFATAGLAKVSLRVTSGAVRPWRGNAGYFLFSPGGQACGATQSSPIASVLDPSVTTEYFSPGTWLPTFAPIPPPGSGSAGDTLTATYVAGRKYSDTFYGAAWGPAYDVPSTYAVSGPGGETLLSINATINYLIGDPAGNANDADARAAISLSARGKTLARLDLHYLNRQLYQHVLRHSGWYALTIHATRRPAHGFQLLSPQMTVRWHFNVSLLKAPGQLPLSYTRFRVRGLNLQNQAAPGARTTIGVSVVGASGVPNKPGWREVKMQVSFDGGRNWHPLRLHRRGRVWTLTFREPVSGNVSLRSTVVSANGDSTVQTIDDAYGIS